MIFQRLTKQTYQNRKIFFHDKKISFMNRPNKSKNKMKYIVERLKTRRFVYHFTFTLDVTRDVVLAVKNWTAFNTRCTTLQSREIWIERNSHNQCASLSFSSRCRVGLERGVDRGSEDSTRGDAFKHVHAGVSQSDLVKGVHPQVHLTLISNLHNFV